MAMRLLLALLVLLRSLVGVCAFVAMLGLLLLEGCGHVLVKGQDDVFLRMEGDCSGPGHWRSSHGVVRVTYTDTKSGAQISYLFVCHDGLLVDPIEEGRVR